MGWYIVINEEMRALGLSGNELMVFALIHGFSQEGQGCFHGSLSYVCEVCGISRSTAIRTLQVLASKGFILKTEKNENGVKSVSYRSSVKMILGVSKCNGGGIKMKPNNTIDNNSYIHKNITNNKGTAKFDFLNALLEAGVSQQVAQDFMQVRKEKKATNSETAFKMLMGEISRSGRSAEECIRVAVANSWKGFKAEWMQNLETPQGRPAPAPKRNNFTDMVSLGQKLGMFKQPTKKEVPDEQ